jgi:LmbE family N-acetylglucosaminyl deacetylase
VPRGPTTVFIHAHPDDESLFTGGRTILGARSGARQVLITLTDGSLGIDPAGRTSSESDHDRASTTARRSVELRAAAAVLGFDRVVELGYRDSGMAGWATTEEPEAFVNQPVAEVTRRLVEVLEPELPCVVVTYDQTGFYGHPDHMATSEAALGAAQVLEGVERLDAVVMTAGDVDAALARALEVGEELPEWLGSRLVTLTALEDVDVVVDASAVAGIKQAALAEHSSQSDNAALVDLAPELFADVFGLERYMSILDRRRSEPR